MEIWSNLQSSSLFYQIIGSPTKMEHTKNQTVDNHNNQSSKNADFDDDEEEDKIEGDPKKQKADENEDEEG